MTRGDHWSDLFMPRLSPTVGFWALAVLSLALGLFTSSATCAAEPPPHRSQAEIEAVLAQAPEPPEAEKLRELNILLLADDKDHGPGEHDYPLWQNQWRALLADHPAAAPKIRVATARRWPTAEQLAKADVLVMFCYPGAPGERVFSREQIDQLGSFVARGGGYVPIHSATYTRADLSTDDSRRLLEITGIMYPRSIQYRHGPIELKIADADHPICLGLPRTLHFVDEPYWPPTGDVSKIHVLATSDETITPGGQETAPQPLFWTREHGRGRVFGCVMGHYAATFDDPYFRVLLLRGIAWAAGESPYRLDHLVLVTVDHQP